MSKPPKRPPTKIRRFWGSEVGCGVCSKTVSWEVCGVSGWAMTDVIGIEQDVNGAKTNILLNIWQENSGDRNDSLLPCPTRTRPW